MPPSPGESSEPPALPVAIRVERAESLTPAHAVDHRDLAAAWITWLKHESARGQLMPMTLEVYERNIGYWLAYLEHEARTDRPSPKTVGDWVADLLQTHKPATVNAYLGTVRSLYTWAEANDRYPAIGRSIRHISEDRDGPLAALTHDQVVALLALIPETSLKHLRDRALLALLYSTGIRCVSVVRANLEDLNLLTRVLLHQAKGRRRTTPAILPPSLAALLERYLAARRQAIGIPPEPGQPLFCSVDRRTAGHRLTGASIRRIALAWMEVAGVARRDADGHLLAPGTYSAHCLRRSAAIRAYEALGPGAAQSLMGHKRIETTEQNYARFNRQQDLENLAGHLNPLG